MSCVVYLLHGFLGKPQDWEFFVSSHNQRFYVPVNLFDIGLPSKTTGLWEWAIQFNEWVKTQHTQKNFLLGYSLGGRLAMHALLQSPELWEAGILVSAHPGLHDLKKKDERLESDEKWAESFLHEEWSSLIQAWDNNKIFKSASSPFIRKESDYDRLLLADVLRYWSLGKQDYLLNKIIKHPLFWIAGHLDSKYATLVHSIPLFHPRSKKWIADETAHRVPWEQKERFIKQVEKFMRLC